MNAYLIIESDRYSETYYLHPKGYKTLKQAEVRRRRLEMKADEGVTFEIKEIQIVGYQPSIGKRKLQKAIRQVLEAEAVLGKQDPVEGTLVR